MDTLLILADDLTGAADTAARCCAAGLAATIFLTPPHPPLPAAVVAFTSDSRHLSPPEAARRVVEVAQPLVTIDARWYKKIDSTLRGNIGSELDALLDLLDAPAALVCPAFPAQARGLVNGYLIAPNLPPVGIHLLSLLRAQSRYPVLPFSLQDVRSGALVERLQRRESSGRALFVVDALTDADLGLVVDAAQAMPALLFCGSAGLIGELARRQAGSPELAGFPKPGSSEGKTVVVVGSGSPMAHRQIGGLLATCPTAAHLVVEAGDIPSAAPLDSPLVLIHQPPPAPGALLDGPIARQRAEKLADAACAL